MRGRYAVLGDGTHVWVIPEKMLPAGHKLAVEHRTAGPYNERQLVVTTDVMVWSLPMTWVSYGSTGEYVASSAATAVGARSPLTKDEWIALDEEVRDLYSEVTARTETEVPFDVSGFARVELHESTMPEAPHNWSPGIQGLIIGPPFDVAFPGWLSGFRARALEIAREYASDTVYDDRGQPKSMTVPIRAYYDPPRTTIVRVMRKQVRRETWLTNQVKVVDINDQIGGGSLIDAERRWAEEEARIRAELEPWTKIRICSHCHGNGVLEEGHK